MDKSTPLRHWMVALATPCLRSNAIPTRASETATQSTAADDIKMLRRRLLAVSLATYSTEMATVSPLPGSGWRCPRPPQSCPVPVDAAGLIAHHRAAVELDHPAPHAVDDALVVGRHDDGRAC